MGLFSSNANKVVDVSFELREHSGEMISHPDLSSVDLPKAPLQEADEIACPLCEYPVYRAGETVKGIVHIGSTESKPLEHRGITVSLVGEVSMTGYETSQFLNTKIELSPQGVLVGRDAPATEYPFEFTNIGVSDETYHGANVRLQYFVRVEITIGKKTAQRDLEIAVARDASLPHSKPLSVSVGARNPDEETLFSIEFSYLRDSYTLADVAEGKVAFHICRAPLRKMYVDLVRRESWGLGLGSSTGAVTDISQNSMTVQRWAIMDGSPINLESIPVRLFLESAGRDSCGRHTAPAVLSPTVRGVRNRFDVRWYLITTIECDDGSNYFKQLEIKLHRA